MKNKGCLIGGGALVGIVVIVGLWLMSAYNGLVPLQENVTAQWSNVENTYQKRMDLINQTVKTVQGAANYEKGALTDVIEARAKATSTQINVDDVSQLTEENIAKYQQAQDQLKGSFDRLLMSVERYPELKAVANFQGLQATIESMEAEILFERKKYNETAKVYNTKIKKFPTNIIANVTGFTEKGYFKAAAGSENAPNIEFSN